MAARIKMQKSVKKLSGYSYFLYICFVEVVFFNGNHFRGLS